MRNHLGPTHYLHRTCKAVTRIVSLIVLSLALAGTVGMAEYGRPVDHLTLDPDTVIRLSKLNPAITIVGDSTRCDSLGIAAPGEENARAPADQLPPEGKKPAEEQALPADLGIPTAGPEPQPADIPVGDEGQPVEKSPAGAVVRSLVVPGWGQFYTENRLKGVLIGGAEVTLFSFWFTERRARDRDLDEYERTGNEAYLSSSVDHGNRADDFLSWAVLTTLLGALDAYIDAHLYRFEEKVSMGDGVEVSFRLY